MGCGVGDPGEPFQEGSIQEEGQRHHSSWSGLRTMAFPILPGERRWQVQAFLLGLQCCFRGQSLVAGVVGRTRVLSPAP